MEGSLGGITGGVPLKPEGGAGFEGLGNPLLGGGGGRVLERVGPGGGRVLERVGPGGRAGAGAGAL